MQEAVHARLRRPASARSGASLLLLAWCLLVLGMSAHEGQFSLYGLVLVAVGLALVVDVVARRRPVTVPNRQELRLPVAVCLLSAVLHPARHNMHTTSGGLLATGLLSVGLGAAAVGALRLPDAWQRRAWLAVAALAAVTGVVTVLVVPNPHIDVWWLLQQSSDGLLRGQDMYRQHWQHSSGLQDVYPYLPGTTLLLAPFRWLLGDVRYGLVAALLLASLVVRRLAPKAPAVLAALLLVMPHWVFLVDQSWTEPLLVLALAGAVLALRCDRPGAAMLALAAALACKQHIVLLLPLFAAWQGFGWKRALQSSVLAGLVVLPWLVMGSASFFHDAVRANLGLGVLERSLCLPSLLSRGGIVVGFWFLLLALAGAYALALRRLPRTPSGLALGCALVLWTLDLANKQSYFNHYFLPLALLVVALAAAPPRQVEG